MHANNPLRNVEADEADDANECVENLRVISIIGCALGTFWALLAIVMFGLDVLLLQWHGNHTLVEGAIGLAIAAVLGLTCALSTAACAFFPWRRNPCNVIKDAATSFRSAWRQGRVV